MDHDNNKYIIKGVLCGPTYIIEKSPELGNAWRKHVNKVDERRGNGSI